MDLQERGPSPSEIQHKKRGRPTGKNRVPLSLDEKRARNALYERERRHAASEAMSLLAEAAGCDSTLSNADILATVISQIQTAVERSSEDNIEQLRRSNEKLINQVETLEQRLSNWEDTQSGNSLQKNSNNKRKRDINTKKVNKRNKPEANDPFIFYTSVESDVIKSVTEDDQVPESEGDENVMATLDSYLLD